MLLVVTESRECGVKEQRDPVNMGTFLNGVFKRESHDTGDPSTPPDETAPSGSGRDDRVCFNQSAAYPVPGWVYVMYYAAIKYEGY